MQAVQAAKPPTTKRCPGCGKDLPLAKFSKNRASRNGLQTYCKLCVSQKTYAPYKRKKPPKETPKHQTPMTWWRRLELERMLTEFYETGSFPNQDWASRREVRGLKGDENKLANA